MKISYRFYILIVLIPASQIAIAQLALVDRSATEQTKNLFFNLREIPKKGIIFGHQDDLAYGVNWKAESGRSDVREVCGDYPGVYGWDISRLGQSENIDSVNFDNMKRWIVEGYKRGGINTVGWHMEKPVTGSDSWDKTPAVAAILPGGQKHEFYKGRLDLVAAFFNSLKGEHGELVPIVFRPFHEHTGNWFWWGRGNCTRDEYVKLWQFTVRYLRDEKQVHNLLWAYSTDQFSSEAQYLEFYPGDDFADILAYDDYHSIKSINEREKLQYRLKTIVTLAEARGKVAALSETGLEGIPISDWFTNVLLGGIQSDNTERRIAWVLVWRNANTKHHYAPYPGHSSAADFVEFYNDPSTLFERDLPDMYKK
ncbi:MAG: glycosyl hydrolase [Cyclobacteriaceae bacterium]|nr:glycosyl hydrolase [Cyclobacteriaceae bacterium]